MDRCVTFKQSPDSSKELGLAVIWGKSIPGGRNSPCKGPEEQRGECDGRLWCGRA